MNNPKKLSVLSLFSGCGGMDLGFEGNFEVRSVCVNTKIHPDWIKGEKSKDWVRLKPTTFKTIFANDILPEARAAWIPYFRDRGVPDNAFHLGSIVDLVKSANNGHREALPFRADVVTGGFPCQDFSVAGKRKGFLSHKSHYGELLSEADEPTMENRGKLYIWMRDVIAIVQPKVFIAENVRGLVSLKDAKSIIENDFRNIGGDGYVVVNARVLNAADYGVPQARQRVFFIGFRKSALRKTALDALHKDPIPKNFDPYPAPTHSTTGRDLIPYWKMDKLLPAVTVRQVLINLKEPEMAHGDLSQARYSKARWMGKHCQGQTEVALDGLGPTIRAEHHGNIEYRRLSKEHGGKYNDELKKGLKERRLTVRECVRIQTFPNDFTFVREGESPKDEFRLSPSDGYRLVGNAVPPLLAYHLARRLQELWPVLFKR